MKTSYSRAWGMREFHTCIYDIFNYREYGDDIKEPYIINQILGINHPQQDARITPTSAPLNESVDNGKEGMRECG